MEGGKIVDYEDKPKGPAADVIELHAPKNWIYHKDDLYDRDVPAFE